MKKKTKIIIILCLFLLVGCGTKKQDEDNVIEDAQVSEWKNTGFVVTEEVTEVQELWTQEYISWAHEEVVYEPETENLYVQESVCGGQIYRFHQILSTQENGKSRYLLEIYDGNTMQEMANEVEFPKMEMESPFIVGMQVTESGQYVFQCVENEGEKRYLVFTDLSDYHKRVDVKGIFESKGLEQTAGAFECIADKFGNS